MSAFREWLAAIERMVARPSARLAAESGPRPLTWSRMMFIPSASDRRAHASCGEFYGRPFRVLFPAGPPPAGHRWGLATWTADRSGTGQAEVRACCATCSDAAGWTVGPLACVTSAEAGWSPDDYRRD